MILWMFSQTLNFDDLEAESPFLARGHTDLGGELDLALGWGLPAGLGEGGI